MDPGSWLRSRAATVEQSGEVAEQDWERERSKGGARTIRSGIQQEQSTAVSPKLQKRASVKSLEHEAPSTQQRFRDRSCSVQICKRDVWTSSTVLEDSFFCVKLFCHSSRETLGSLRDTSGSTSN